MKKNYWLFLEPYVHVSLKNKAALLYNLLDGHSYEIKNNKKFFSLIKLITAKKNNLSIKITEGALRNSGMKHFISRLRASFMGDLIPSALIESKPFQISPILNIYKEVCRKKPNMSFNFGKNIMQNLFECSLYITNQSDRVSYLYHNAYKQFLTNLNSSEAGEISISELTKLFLELKSSPIFQINILGGNVFYYSELSRLISLLDKFSAQKTIFFNYLDFEGHENLFLKYLKEKSNKFSFKIFVDFPVKSNQFVSTMNLIKEQMNLTGIVFIVEKPEHIEEANSYISAYQIINYKLQPYFNGSNRLFFKNSVFMRKTEILHSRVKQQEVFAKQVINPLDFGKITILSNGDIYANLNKPKLGNLKRNTIHDVVFKEMKLGKSWRSLRTNAIPCKNCLLNLLCPPLSSYEYAIKRNNLCTLKIE